MKIINYDQVFGLTPGDYAIYMQLDKIDITGQNKKQNKRVHQDSDSSSDHDR